MIDFALVAVHSDDDLVHRRRGHYKMIAHRMCNVFLILNESSIEVYFDRVALRNSIKLMLCDC